ncbi:hypothetical protein Droror1_Dr00001925 [Drosera rotundifolia]
MSKPKLILAQDQRIGAADKDCDDWLAGYRRALATTRQQLELESRAVIAGLIFRLRSEAVGVAGRRRRLDLSVEE